MSETAPYTYYSCPCTDIIASPKPSDSHLPAKNEDEEGTFDPRLPRANYALYPLEQLLYCNECHELRCPRCYYQEAIYYFCPSCLFETSSTAVKNETNRCTRSCFQCPICIAPLVLNSLATQAASDSVVEKTSALEGPFILTCQHCSWSTLDIGIKFEKGVNISGQLAKIRNGGEVIALPKSNGKIESDFGRPRPKAPDQFSLLADFYKGQFLETAQVGSGGLRESLGFDSPSSLSRLMSHYGVGGSQKQKGKASIMREAEGDSEGIELISEDESDVIAKMQQLGWNSISGVDQRSNQTKDARFFSDFRPIATQLLSKRATRCRTCRNNLVKPEDKRHSTRYKIRLLALNYIPRITLKALDPATNYNALPSLQPVQYLLTLRNPLFEPVKITLATPSTTTGSIDSKITILCPQFDIGANTDVWDAALDAANKDVRNTRDFKAAEGQQPEAGKVWERGRNWTTVVLEVIPGLLRRDASDDKLKADGLNSQLAGTEVKVDGLLEVPIFVRMEYETEDSSVGVAEDVASKTSRDKKVRRELAYWCLVGVGRIMIESN